MGKGHQPEVIEAEVVDDGLDLEPDVEFINPKRGSSKLPMGKRKKDFSKFNQRTREACLSCAARGMADSRVAGLAGISPETLKRWLNRGQRMDQLREDGEDLLPVDEDFADFYVKYNQAKAAPQVEVLDAIREHAMRDGRVGIEFLKMTDPENYNTSRSKVEVQHGGTIALQPKVDQLKQLPASELRALIRAMEDQDQKALPAKGDG